MALEATNYIRHCFLCCLLVELKINLCTLSSSILRLTGIISELCDCSIAFSRKALHVMREFISFFFCLLIRSDNWNGKDSMKQYLQEEADVLVDGFGE